MQAHSTRDRDRPSNRPRRLLIEPLEDRRLLAAGTTGEGFPVDDADTSPWQNPAFRLDVNNDSVTTVADAVALVNRILTGGIGDLPPPETNPPEFFVDTSGDNRLTVVDLVRVVNGLLSPPEVTLSLPAPQTPDVTPLVTVTATGKAGVPDGTVVDLDVDLNDDGDFADAGELSHTQSTLAGNSSTFEIAPAVAGSTEVFSINLRARVKDANAVPGASLNVPLVVDTDTSDVISNYVSDPSGHVFQLAEDDGVTNPIPGVTVAGSYLYYIVDMTSQTWRSTDDVDSPTWRHWLEVYVPVEVSGEVIEDLDDTGILVIDSGSNIEGVPQSPEPGLALGATLLRTIVTNLTIVPNSPVTFSGETEPRIGNEIIAYTFDQFMDHFGEAGNETWPALVPMVNSAVRAMDTVQDFAVTLAATAQINDFVLSGASDRGWTAWLTAAVDPRVASIVPLVFENLNIGQQMVHHYGVYGFFSEAFASYQDLQVFDRILTAEGQELTRIVDPYRYLNNGRFDDMPKLLINSPGDEFFASDSAQHYFHDIPGDQNYLRYVPNTSHSLEFAEDEVAESTVSFVEAVLHDRPLPEFSWTVDPDETIRVTTVTAPSQVRLWQMNNVNTRDFRRVRFPGMFWFSRDLVDQGGGTYVTDVAMPSSGARAYFVELTFPNPQPGLPDFVFTTEVRVKSTLPLNPWPFESGAAEPLPAAALSAIASSTGTEAAESSAEPVRTLVTRSDGGAEPKKLAGESSSPILLEAPAIDELAEAGVDAEAVDYIVSSTLAELLD